ncbi:MAG: RDD family protein [Comamonas sp.]|nr:RDD family protein [Comamonas sp.]
MSASSPASRTLAPAGLTRRMACWLYEGIVLFALMMVAVLLQSALALLLPALNHPALLQATTLALWGAYFIYFWQRGQTLPMKTWRITVLDAQGRPLSRARALTRYAFGWVWGLPLLVQLTPWHLTVQALAIALAAWVVLWMAASRLHPQGQFWHDAWAGTQLVQAA